jgi:DNA-binding PadR family transcriptional regulator
MEFEITPGKANAITNRSLALISLHPDFTYYLGQIEKRTRPIELSVLQLTTTFSGEGYRSPLDKKIYVLKEEGKKQIKNFAKTFELKYPEVEQVYVLSAYSDGPEKQIYRTTFHENILESLNDVLEQLILKRYLILEYPEPYCKGYYKKIRDSTNPIEMQKIIERSLRFNSW